MEERHLTVNSFTLNVQVYMLLVNYYLLVVLKSLLFILVACIFPDLFVNFKLTATAGTLAILY